MRHTVVKLLIQVAGLAVAIVLTVTLLPGVRIEQPTILLYLSLGLALSLLNTFVRPVLVMLTGRLLIATMGLFLVVLNSAVFWLIYLLFPQRLVLQSPQLVWIILAGVLVSLFATLIEAILGLNRPEFDTSGRGHALWRLLDTLPTPRRNALIENLRIQQIYDTLLSFGLDIVVSRTVLQNFREWISTRILRRPYTEDELGAPSKVRVMLQQLGPTYVKFGQMAASQAGTLPPEWQTELAKLQSTVAPFPSSEAAHIVEQELKKPLAELYATFDETPLAAASTAQVHRATLPDGTPVVVKVQRPRIIAQTKADLGILQQIGGVLAKRFRWARALDLYGVLSEFAAGVLKELDYNNEAYQAQRLADNLRAFENVRVPAIYPSHSSARVLTMEYVEGVKATNTAALDAAALDRPALSAALTRAFVKQILFDGFFHGDPHPGNLMINPRTGVITLIDCGLVGELSQAQRMDFLDLIWSFTRKDVRGLSDVFFRLCRQTRQVDKPAYYATMDRIIYQFVVYNAGANFGSLMNAALGSLYEMGLRMDSNLTLAIKAIMQMEEAACALDPGHDLGRVATEYAQAHLREQLTAEKVSSMAQEQVIRLGREVARRLPELQDASMKWLDMFTKGGLEVKLDTSGLSEQMTQLDVILRRLVIGLVLAGLIVGTAIVASSPFLASRSDLPAVATAVFVVVVVASLLVVWRMARNSKPTGRL